MKHDPIDVGIYFKHGKIFNEFKVSDNFNELVHKKNITDLVSQDGDYLYCNCGPYLITGFNEKVIGIELMFKYDKVGLGEPFKLIKYKASLASVLKTLNENNITWFFDSKYVFKDQLCITTEGNVNLLFGKSQTGKIELEKVASTFEW